jgi:hypothetical protein
MSLNMIIDFSTMVVMGLLILTQRGILKRLRDHRQGKVVDLKRVQVEKGDLLIFESQERLSEYHAHQIRTVVNDAFNTLGWSPQDVQVLVMSKGEVKLNKVLWRRN